MMKTGDSLLENMEVLAMVSGKDDKNPSVKVLDLDKNCICELDSIAKENMQKGK